VDGMAVHARHATRAAAVRRRSPSGEDREDGVVELLAAGELEDVGAEDAVQVAGELRRGSGAPTRSRLEARAVGSLGRLAGALLRRRHDNAVVDQGE
jgi:hypothetical protein